jgi:hypothetical protein
MNLAKRRTTKKREKVNVFKFSAGGNLLSQGGESRETEMFQMFEDANALPESQRSSMKRISGELSEATDFVRVAEDEQSMRSGASQTTFRRIKGGSVKSGANFEKS